MSMRLATLASPLADIPATREAPAASPEASGSFSHAMNDAGQAEALAQPNQPPATGKPASALEADSQPGSKALDGANGSDPAVAAVLAQFLASPPLAPANMPTMASGMPQQGPQALDSDNAGTVPGTTATQCAMEASRPSAQAQGLVSSGLMAGLAPTARGFDKNQQALQAELPTTGLPNTIHLVQGQATPAQTAASATSTSTSLTSGAHTGEAKQTDTPVTASASSAPGATDDWAALMVKLNERSAGTSSQPTATLPLTASKPEHWKEPLLNTLGERVQWQIQRGSEQAMIRLEPPHLGQIDIVIRQEAGQMQVHLSATHREVAQQLQGISDGLRHELSLRQAADVQVQVSEQSAQSYKGQGQGRARQDAPAGEPGRALGDAEAQAGTQSAFSMHADQG